MQKDFGGKRPSRGQDYTDNLNAVYGDSEYFVMTVITAAQLAAKSQQPVFHYLYAHHGSVSLTDFIAQPPWKIIARVSLPIKSKLLTPTWLTPWAPGAIFIKVVGGVLL